jgi:hypothetical protein
MNLCQSCKQIRTHCFSVVNVVNYYWFLYTDSECHLGISVVYFVYCLICEYDVDAWD